MSDKIKQVETDASDSCSPATHSDVVDENFEERVKQLAESLAYKDHELTALRNALAKAVDKYRTAVLSTAPGVPDELLQGETVEEIDASLDQAQRIVLQVRQQLDNDVATRSIPAGAPPRSGIDVSGLSGQAKIQASLRQELFGGQ